MRSHSRSTCMWGVTVAGLCVLWFAVPAGAVPLESWDNKIPNANQRFKVLTEFNNEAVLDKETQLVWERSPSATSNSWNAQRYACADKLVGGRKGWRLPSLPELTSLLDLSVPFTGPLLPLGHPFLTVQASASWSATTDADVQTSAWSVAFHAGNVNTPGFKGSTLPGWCVRGAMNADAY